MRVNKAEMRAMIDVDGTLIRDCSSGEKGSMSLDYYGQTVSKKPMRGNIKLLKAYKKRGYEIVVSSANGWQWAEEVIKVLKLEEYVDEVNTKYLKLVDDLPPNDWLPRIFIEET